MRMCLSDLTWREQIVCDPSLGGSALSGVCGRSWLFIAALVVAYIVGRREKKG
jgi:hypothetical protein